MWGAGSRECGVGGQARRGRQCRDRLGRPEPRCDRPGRRRTAANTMTAAGPPGPVVRSNRAMNVIAALLESRTGQQIDASRAWRIETALKPVLRARGIETLDGDRKSTRLNSSH